MATKKNNKKIENSGFEDKLEQGIKKGIKEVKKVSGELMDKVETLKKRYNKMDGATKKKIITGIVGATVVLAGASALKRAHNKK